MDAEAAVGDAVQTRAVAFSCADLLVRRSTGRRRRDLACGCTSAAGLAWELGRMRAAYAKLPVGSHASLVQSSPSVSVPAHGLAQGSHSTPG